MSGEEKQLYKLNNDVCFRVCAYEDCTDKNSHWSEHTKRCIDNMGGTIWACNHEGEIHLHCVNHTEAELVILDKMNGPRSMKLICPICSLKEDYQPPSSLQRLDAGRITTLKLQSKSLLNSSIFKNAKLIRLDDYYTPELSEKTKTTDNSDYWLSYDVKENKEGKPVLILYLGNRKEGTKSQFFIEPESNKLSHDHKDDDPLSIIARIEVQFQKGTIEFKDKK